MNAERTVRLHKSRYAKTRLLHKDPRFARTPHYIFWLLHAVQLSQLINSINVKFRQGTAVDAEGIPLNAQTAREVANVERIVSTNKGYRFMRQLRGTPDFWTGVRMDLMAMVRQLGTPTWFLTMSAADMQWPDVLRAMYKAKHDRVLSDNEIEQMSGKNRARLLCEFPVIAAAMYNRRVQVIFQMLKRYRILGELDDFAYRFEWQSRGSPHVHCILWIRNAPKIGVNPMSDVIEFIDKYISTSSEQYSQLIHLQRHKHKPSCQTKMFNEKKPKTTSDEDWSRHVQNQKCRFNFPKQVSETTRLEMEGYGDISEMDLQDSEFAEQLQISRINVIYKRREEDKYVNPYNPHILNMMKSNHDLQYCTNVYAVITYMVSYVSKCEPAVTDALRQVVDNFDGSENARKKFFKIGNAFFNSRAMSVQEAIHSLMGWAYVRKSRAVIFVPTGMPNDRMRMRKPDAVLEMMGQNRTDIFVPNLIEKYEHRPNEEFPILLGLSLASFAANYRLTSKKPVVQTPTQDNDLEEPDEIEDGNDEDEAVGDGDQLPNGFEIHRYGHARKMLRKRVIRYYKYDIAKEEEKFYYSYLLLFFPFIDENRDLALNGPNGHFKSFKEFFISKRDVIMENAREYEMFVDVIEAAYERIRTETTERIEELIDDKFGDRAFDIADDLSLDDDSENGLQDLINPEPGPTDVFIGVPGNDDVPSVEYVPTYYQISVEDARRLLAERLLTFNSDQRTAFDRGKELMEQYAECHAKHHSYRGNVLFVSGPGGTGKSHLLHALRWLSHSMFATSPTDMVCLVVAPTGVAAVGVDGTTIHQALGFRPQQGTDKIDNTRPSALTLNKLRNLYHRLAVILIDEISMVSADMFHLISDRLNVIMQEKNRQVHFGGIVVIVFGDLFQFSPVASFRIFCKPKSSNFYGPIHVWCDLVELVELTQIERQKGDPDFAECLSRIRVGRRIDEQIVKEKGISNDAWLKMPGYTVNDIKYLMTRHIVNLRLHENHQDLVNVLHIFHTNADVTKHNKKCLERQKKAGVRFFQSVAVDDFVNEGDRRLNLSKLLPKSADKTGGLEEVIEVTEGCPIMIRRNIAVPDKLVNGTTGHVIDWNNNVLWVQFEKIRGEYVGQQTRQKFLAKSVNKKMCSARILNDRTLVPIEKVSVTFLGENRRTNLKRFQYPIKVCFATTIHKMQGSTVTQLAISLKKGKANPAGLAYVGLSRCTSLNGLFLLHFDEQTIRADPDVLHHMELLRKGQRPTPIKRIDLSDVAIVPTDAPVDSTADGGIFNEEYAQHSDNGATVFIWSGGITTDRDKLQNSCPIDPWATIFDIIRRENLLRLDVEPAEVHHPAHKLLLRFYQLIDSGKYAAAKRTLINQEHCVGILDAFNDTILVPRRFSYIWERAGNVQCALGHEVRHLVQSFYVVNELAWQQVREIQNVQQQIAAIHQIIRSTVTDIDLPRCNHIQQESPDENNMIFYVEQEERVNGVAQLQYRCNEIQYPTDENQFNFTYSHPWAILVELPAGDNRVYLKGFPLEMLVRGRQYMLRAIVCSQGANGGHFVAGIREFNLAQSRSKWFYYDSLEGHPSRARRKKCLQQRTNFKYATNAYYPNGLLYTLDHR